MTYFELLNNVLLEFGLNKLEKFENAYKNEHFRILEALKSVNSEILRAYDWHFLNKHKTFELLGGEESVIIEDLAKIHHIKRNGKLLLFDKNYVKNGEKLTGINFWSYSDRNKIVVYPFENGSKIEVFYKSNNFAIAQNGDYKANFEEKDDKSVLGKTADEILIYGACINVKGANSPKYAIWDARKKNALRDFVVNNRISADDEPKIRINKCF